MLVYVMTFEPYHENSSVIGVFTDYKTAMDSLIAKGAECPNPRWDDSDSFELREWDTLTQKLTRRWINFNPHIDRVKQGWRVEEVRWTR